MKIDVSKFKKMESDEKHTVLQHPNGHSIKIAHKGLSPEYRKELEDLPMHMAKGGKASKPSKSSNTMPGSPTMAEKNFTEPDAMGTSIPRNQLMQEMHDKQIPDVVVSSMNREGPPMGALGAAKQHYPPCINPSCKSYGRSHPNCRCYGGKFAKGGKVGNFCDVDRKHDQGCEYYADGDLVEESPTEGPAQDVTVHQGPYRDESGNLSGPQEENVAENAANIVAKSAKEDNPKLNKGLDPDLAAEIDNSPNQPISNANTEIENKPPVTEEPPVEKAAASAQNTTASLHDESQKLQQDLNNGHVTPETYKDLFNKKDTLGKIGTIFGLLVGGMGSGLAHQPNMLMEMMNNEINNDLKAQEASASNRQNFMKIAQQGLLNKATVTGVNLQNQQAQRALEWSYASRVALHDQIQKVMKLPEGSPARQNAMQALSIMSQGIDKKEADMFSQAGLAQALQESSFGGQGQGGQPNTMMMKSGLMGQPMKEMGQDIEDKTLNINGRSVRASRPIEPSDRKEVTAMNILDDKSKDLLDFAKSHKGTLSLADRALGEQKAEEMVNFYNNSIQGGVLTATRLPWLQAQIGKSPTSVFQDVLGNNKRLEEIRNSNNHRRDILLKTYGISSPSGESKAGSSKQQKQVQTMNGVQYEKVGNAWHRVK